jgi:hypothetical protein
VRNRLVYTWNFTQSRGVEFWPGVNLYITTNEAEVGKAFALDIGRLHVRWRRGDEDHY